MLKIAKYISVIGHPLLTVPVFTIIAVFTFDTFGNAVFVSSLITGGISIPLAIKMYKGAKNKTYTNFDVSDKTQRQNWYVLVLVLLLLVTLILFITDQSRQLRLTILFAFILLLTLQIANLFIKSSLHVALNIFLVFLIVPMNLLIGALFFAFAIAVAWSRLVLQRHTLKEIISGAIIGGVIGALSLVTITGYLQKI